MTQQTIFTGQSITKDCVVGDRLMNRYSIFNGIERPRRVGPSGEVTLLGVDAAADPTLAADGGAGNIAAGWYAWKAVYASSVYTRPVAVLDGSGNYTRGNPSTDSVSLNVGAGRQVNVAVPTITQAGITHILLYRSLESTTQALAEAGPFYYVAQGLIAGAGIVINDNVADAAVGLEVETDNFPPNSYRYAIAADSYVFAIGNFPIGTGFTCTVTPGSPLVTVDSGDAFYDGIRGWRFNCLEDTSGGTNGDGLYFANYVDATTLTLIDGNGNSINYDGDLTGAGQTFMVYLSGNVLRWSKKGEPESWPTDNLINFEGDGTGLAQIPNQPLLLVCTDEPTMYILDLNVIGLDVFKTNKNLISTEFTASSHYSLVAVKGRTRGIDATKSVIFETDGTSVSDISGSRVPKIFTYLSDDMNDIKLWHCAYDHRQELFGAFVTFKGATRLIDFCIGQHTLTNSWFFNWEKDLLSTGTYVHPDTGESMILGGTEGPGGGLGGVWGRIWCPNVYSEWIPVDTLLSGTITNVVGGTIIDVDTTDDTLASGTDTLVGRWVLVCDEKGEYSQVGYIISNTASRIVVNQVINGMDPLAFSPVPEIGWKFYLGMIECRWGPKKFDMGDPDVNKYVWEVWNTVHDHNESDPPFIRVYRGYETSYTSQLTLSERQYLDNTLNQSLVNKVDNKLEPVPRWGVAWYDRSYGPTSLNSLSIVFTPQQTLAKK